MGDISETAAAASSFVSPFFFLNGQSCLISVRTTVLLAVPCDRVDLSKIISKKWLQILLRLLDRKKKGMVVLLSTRIFALLILQIFHLLFQIPVDGETAGPHPSALCFLSHISEVLISFFFPLIRLDANGLNDVFHSFPFLFTAICIRRSDSREELFIVILVNRSFTLVRIFPPLHRLQYLSDFLSRIDLLHQLWKMFPVFFDLHRISVFICPGNLSVFCTENSFQIGLQVDL